jgi:hypothetical protein
MNRSSGPTGRADRPWLPRFLRNVLLWLVPVWAMWAILTPGYNRFLLASGQNLLHWTEHPNATVLTPQGPHDAVITHLNLGKLRQGFRVTDLHFHLVLLLALFLAVPDVPWRDRLGHLGWAVLFTIFFDIFLVFFTVKAIYATQLEGWSVAHYGPFARNAYGLLHHLLDLPGKLGLPLMLWAAFYLPLLLRSRSAKTSA